MRISDWSSDVCSSDLGTLYLIFAIIAGIIGAFFSLIRRMELQEPGVQFLLSGGEHDGNLLNVLVTAHDLVMIFFAIMPALLGVFGTSFEPLMIGSPDQDFPHQQHITFWISKSPRGGK